MTEYGRILDNVAIEDIAVPHDCSDGFLGAYWRRPHAYLDPSVRASISTFAKLDDAPSNLRTLERDLASGEWERRYGHLMEQEYLDAGYRLVISD